MHVPFDSRLGAEFLGVEEGVSRYRVTVQADHCNPFGITHGGLYASLMDSAMGQCIASSLDEGQVASNVDLQIQLRTGSKPGDVLEAASWITKRGRTAAFLDAEVRRGDQVIATARSVYLIRDQKS